MKIFLVYASAGAGHLKAAEALYKHIKERHKEYDVRLIDVLDYASYFFRFSYTSGYSFLINHAVFLWKIVFYATEFGFLRSVTRAIASFMNRLNTKKFIGFLCKENPDLIISTHFLTSEIPAFLKNSGKIDSRLITVITDFGVHPFWISSGTDQYIVASDLTKKILVEQGIDGNIIKVLGIPIDPKFLKHYDRAALSSKLGIDKDKFTILVVTGSFGLGPIEKIVDLLHDDVQILVVCARNQRLYRRLKNKNYANVSVFGFVDNIQELMSASDIIITKPGGLTSSEVLAVGIVPIFISAIPGQETENVKTLESYGVGISVKNISRIKEIVLDYKEHPDNFRKTRENINAIKKPFATEEICNAVCKDSSWASG